MAVKNALPEDYEQQGYKLLPVGPAWKQPDPIIQALGDAAARAHNRAVDLIDEADPRTTDELMADWERVAGLPDPCVTGEQSTPERYAALLTKLTSLGGQSAAYFVQLAAGLGNTVSISEFDEFTVDDDVDAAINGSDWNFAWQVTATATAFFEMTVNDSVDDPLASWSNAPLECVFERYKPAHTTIIFAYP